MHLILNFFIFEGDYSSVDEWRSLVILHALGTTYNFCRSAVFDELAFACENRIKLAAPILVFLKKIAFYCCLRQRSRYFFELLLLFSSLVNAGLLARIARESVQRGRIIDVVSGNFLILRLLLLDLLVFVD